MPAERYFLDTEIEAGSSYTLEGSEFQHLSKVMRAQTGDTVGLVNGRGVLAECHVGSIDKRKATLVVDALEFHDRPQHEIIIAQALPRLNRLDNILEKGTELGMTQLWLFPGDLSEMKDLADKRLERMRAVTVAALKQCGRLHLPDILVKAALSKTESLPHPSYFGDTRENAPTFVSKLSQQDKKTSLIFFVGPESGFTEKEIQHLETLGSVGVKLHHNILRTDTASLVALSAWSTVSGP